MSWLLNLVYLAALLLLSPWLLYRALKTKRYRAGLRAKLLGLGESVPGRCVWFHGVSLGEIHLLRSVIAAFRKRRPDLPCVLSTTTDTGFAEARKCFPDLAVFRFPFDFSWAVTRTLRRVDPVLVVLAESEIWPNFLMAARRQGVPVAIINGRMSPRSTRRYHRLGGLARFLLGHLDLIAVQDEEHARNLAMLGIASERVHVTRSVKYDGARTDRDNPRTRELRRLLNVTDRDLIWVAGSTQAPEEEVILRIHERLRPSYPNLRLFLVPRHPERFEEVARLLERAGVSFVRRSAIPSPQGVSGTPGVVLVDTLGELGALWGVADVAFVGGSLDGKRGGQNMIEPAAFGAAVVFGPHVWNFRDTVDRLLGARAACQVADAGELETVVRDLLDHPDERRRLGEAARQFVLRQQGATEQTVALLDRLLTGRVTRSDAA